MLDIHTFIGPYPFRHVPHPEPEVLVRVMDREQVAAAWVAHLPSAFFRDPEPGNDALCAAVAPHPSRLHPVFTVRPDWSGWKERVARAVGRGAVAIRAYPQLWGLVPGAPALAELAAVCAHRNMPIMLNVRFEDSRQRHPLDVAGDLPAATIRELARAGTGARIVVTAASRALIEEVHWGLTVAERTAVLWDISWIWGPPEDDLAHLLATIGPAQFAYGSGWPLRLAQTPRANLSLLEEQGTSRSFARLA